MKHPMFVGLFTSIYVYGTYRMYKELFTNELYKNNKYIKLKYFGR